MAARFTYQEFFRKGLTNVHTIWLPNQLATINITFTPKPYSRLGHGTNDYIYAQHIPVLISLILNILDCVRGMFVCLL